MKNDTPKVLKGKYRWNGNIIFDDNGITILEDLHSLVVNLGICFLVVVATLVNYLNYQNTENRIGLLFVLLSIVSIITLVIGFFKYINAKKNNNSIFPIPDIQRIQIKETKHIVKVGFEFKGKSKYRISIINNNSYLEFIDTLKRNEIKMIRTNNR